MLRCQAQLARGVVLGKLLDEGMVGVEHRIVEADAASDEDLLHSWKLSELPQEVHIALVGDREVLAGSRREAAPVRAGTCCRLLLAGTDHELGSGATHIVDIALEVRVVGHGLSLAQERFLASCLDDPALMEVQGTEGTLAEAASVARKRELHFLQGWYASLALIHRVVRARIGKLVDLVELFCRQRLCGRVLDSVDVMRIGLDKRVGEKGVEVPALDAERLCIDLLVARELIPGGEDDRMVALLIAPGTVDRTLDPGDVRDRDA